MGLDSHSLLAVALVTGGSVQAGRDLARTLASWAWPIVIVYLDHQARVEATVAEIIGAGGAAVAVRADLADDLDVQRVFDESITAFGGVDVVVHTTTQIPVFLYEHAARYVRQGGAIVTTTVADPMGSSVASRLRERGITVGRVTPESALVFLDGWPLQSSG